jgi:hypothetical protein
MTLSEALAINALIQSQSMGAPHDKAQERAHNKAREIIADIANAAIEREWERR